MSKPEKPLSILAIDDDPADLKLLKISMSNVDGLDNFTFYGFTDWESARSELDTLGADLIFVDYLLGIHTGLDVVKGIRDRGDLRPIIVLTGQGDATIAAKITRAGADDYLSKKDLDKDTLRRAVSNALAQYKLRSEKEVLTTQLAQAQKMETIGSLTGGIAHDFNNMLTVVRGGIELAGEISTEPEVCEELSHAKNACDQMGELVRQLLNFSRKEDAEILDLNITDILTQLNAILKHTLPKNINIKIDSQEEHAVVKANPTLLQQVLLNLCINASEAMSNGGELTLSTKNHPLKSQTFTIKPVTLPKGDYIIIEVKDTGDGIEKEILTRIFEPFFTTKQLGSKKGTGLGLSIVWQNVKNMGGTITVDSSPDEGTTFNIILPKGGSKGKTALTPISENKNNLSKNSGTILIIDDEEHVINLTEKMLVRLGYKVFSALSGKNAVEIFSGIKDDVDLVILDLSMPDMSGMECFKALKKINPFQKIYFASGHDMAAKKQSMLDVGATGVIQKPYGYHELASAVKSAIH